MLLGITDEIVPAMGEEGFWIGIVTGLTTAAIAMLIRLALVIKKYNQTTNELDAKELVLN
jgi:MATE family multidrug resistance protein